MAFFLSAVVPGLFLLKARRNSFESALYFPYVNRVCEEAGIVTAVRMMAANQFFFIVRIFGGLYINVLVQNNFEILRFGNFRISITFHFNIDYLICLLPGQFLRNNTLISMQ